MNIEYKILSATELSDYLIDYNVEDCYAKVDKAIEDIKYFDNGRYDPTSESFVYFCAFTEQEVVGIAKLRTGDSNSSIHGSWSNWISFVSVREGYFGHGIGKNLLLNLFEYCKKNKISVLMSGYSVRGWLHLRKYIHEYAAQFGVAIRDDAKRPMFIDWEDSEGFPQTEYDKIVESLRNTECLAV